MDHSQFARILTGGALALAISACATAAPARPPTVIAVVEVREAPPPLPIYLQPENRVEGYIWAPGYWHWAPGGYYWVPGTWVQPPQVGLFWTPGYWSFTGASFVFHEGYWSERVGYYGAINYGGGYGGVGYAGGRWAGSTFQYNTAVSRVNVTVVHNTYNQTVVNNVTVINNTTNNTRVVNVSYAGGPGGTAATPTSQEIAWERQKHVQPTPAQLEHRDGARANPAQFVTRNQGRPPIAATPRPSAFTATETTAASREPAGPVVQREPARPSRAEAQTPAATSPAQTQTPVAPLPAQTQTPAKATVATPSAPALDNAKASEPPRPMSEKAIAPSVRAADTARARPQVTAKAQLTDSAKVKAPSRVKPPVPDSTKARALVQAKVQADKRAKARADSIARADSARKPRKVGEKEPT